jgi:ABC transporter substrate binding protein
MREFIPESRQCETSSASGNAALARRAASEAPDQSAGVRSPWQRRPTAAAPVADRRRAKYSRALALDLGWRGRRAWEYLHSAKGDMRALNEGQDLTQLRHRLSRRNSIVRSFAIYLREFGTVPATLADELAAAPVRDEVEVEAAIAAIAREPAGGLIAAADPFTRAHRALIMRLAQHHRLPAVYAYRQFVAEGGLMSYGPDTVDIVRRSASYVDRILKGATPADLPIQQPTKFELAINLKTAKSLGLDVPLFLQQRAVEVIE